MIDEKKLRIPDFLEHIADAISRIEQYTENSTLHSFESDCLVQDAVYRNFEIIGEAANYIKQLDETFWARHPNIDFKQAYAMRNALSHAYFTANAALVWETIRRDLPSLKRGIDRIRRDLRQHNKSNAPKLSPKP